jgi:transposase
MLYLAIDQHRKQLTVNLRDENGEVVLRRQVSTQPARVRAFVAEVAQRAAAHGGCVAVVEVCGFNDWLLELLDEHGIRVLLVQPQRRNRHKTDRRDSNDLGELLWVNRHRLLAGQKVHGVRVVQRPTRRDAEDRQLTALRQRLGQLRTRTLNKIQRLLLKHNLHHHCPTKGLQTKAARKWLETVALPEIDRLEMDLLLAQWNLWDAQLDRAEEQLTRRHADSREAQIVATVPGAGIFGSLALASRIGSIDRFARPGSLANYWGLVPGCRNSGEATQRLGSITKEGSALARFVLGQMVLHVLRRDASMKAWYLRIKRRRGAKIARVAVMRRLVSVLWHMLRQGLAYEVCRQTGKLRREAQPAA